MTPGTHRSLRPLFAALTLAVMPMLAACDQESDPRDPIVVAQEALARGDGFAAEALLQQAIEAGADRTSIAAMMGEAELLQDSLPEARDWLASGEFDDASRARGFHALARLEMRVGNLPAAGAAFDQALMSDPENAEIWADIGRLRYRGGEQLQAIEAADRAVELNHKSAQALHFRGQLARDAHGLAVALAWFEAALAQDPNDPQVLADYAATLGELGRAREMLVAVRKLARVEPGSPQVYYLQAVLAARAGKHALARTLLQRSGELERDVPAAMLLSALIDMQGGNYASASQMLARLYDIQPDNRRIETLLARSLYLSGSEAELVYRFGGLARRPSASPYLLTLVGRAHEALAERAEAAFYLDKAIEPRPSNLIAMRADALTESRAGNSAIDGNLVSVIRALIVRGNTAAAASRMEQAGKRFSGSADVMSLAGDAHYARRNHGTALNRYRTSARVRRPWSMAKRMIMAYRAQGEQGEAKRLLVAHFAGDPGNGEAAGLVAASFASDGRLQDAADVLDHAFANGTQSDASLFAMRARLAAAFGDDAAALELARYGYAIQPSNALAAAILAPLERKAGAGDEVADELMAKAVALGGDEARD